MKQFNYPTTILFGEGALKECAKRIYAQGLKKPLVVTDKTLMKIGMVDKVVGVLKEAGLSTAVFDGVHPNPIEDDVHAGVAIYNKEKCDCFVALGGGSPMDAAKGIMLAINHHEPLEIYDDAKGGDKFITGYMPPLFAIPTTAGTGSEVGRAGVIILKKTGDKTILFHPTMMPRVAVLEPELTVGLPASITAATGIDAFTHCMEAYFAPGFHPMADGVALEGMRLILKALPIAVQDGKNLEARGEMLLAASMGATAFQKGLGMIHSLAHPLSSECDMHHGLANAVMLPACVQFLESAKLNEDQKARLKRVQALFAERGLAKATLSESCTSFFQSVGIKFGLRNHGVKEEQIEKLSDKAIKDGCHQTNMIPVTRDNLKSAYKNSY